MDSKPVSPLGPLPPGWRLVEHRDIATKIGSGATPRGGESVYLAKRSKFALVRSQNVYDHRFDDSSLAFISDHHAHELRGAEIKPGDLLLNITGDGVTFARACLAPEAILPACVNQHVSIVRLQDDVCLPGYLLAYLTHPEIKGYIESFNAGGSRRAITKGNIESFRIPIPPLNQQKVIADILESLDEKIELNRRTNQTLEATARAIFKSWFVNFEPIREEQSRLANPFHASSLGLMPEDWEVGALKDFVEDAIGGDWGEAAPSDTENEAVLCVRGADIPYLQDAEPGKMPVRFLSARSLTKRALRHGDLVIEISGGSPGQSTGRCVLIRQRMLDRFSYPLVCSNFCRDVRLRLVHSSVYLYFWLDWLYSRGELLQYENGTTGIKNLAFRTFSEVHQLVVPSEPALHAFYDLTSPLLDRQQSNGVESSTLATLRDTILPKLLSGEIRVKQAEKIVGAAF
jgi:type I restriction enzyme, S subunit